MTNLTIRNISNETISIIRTLSQLERRSINSEILTILERGIQKEIKNYKNRTSLISSETQLKMWENLANRWEDDRTTKEIIDDIYNSRTTGRDINL